MLLGLLLDLIGTVALVPVVGGTMGAYAVDKTLNENKIILTKSYANKEIDWVWGEDPDKFNFQDFIGLTPDEVKFIIPDIKEKEEKALRKLDYYELNLLFNEQVFAPKWNIYGQKILTGRIKTTVFFRWKILTQNQKC
ncbi:MAG: hypothetical protein J6V90_07330 [Treponema sp.]|nr:hypothetical protein [Treponema sp.]